MILRPVTGAGISRWMISWVSRGFVLSVLLGCAAYGQAGLTGTEAGLEDAVRWKWRQAPSDVKSWGLEIPEPPPEVPAAPVVPGAPPMSNQENSYEVRRGDALILIAKKHGRTVAQLKAANGLQNDMIRVGQVIKIPTIQECIALGLPPEKPAAPKQKASGKSAPDPGLDMEALILQVFLDGQNFSAGPIDGKSSPAFQKLVYLYQTLKGRESVVADAHAAVGEPVSRYKLRAEDFRFIAPPKAEKPAEKAPPKPAKQPAPIKLPAPVYADMTSSQMMPYRTPWEFVAERFHCDEGLLKALNPEIKTVPMAGTEFQVPNVRPFAIESALTPPLQPDANPREVVTAAIVDLSRIEIYRNDQIEAILPVSPARPGLRGRGTWKILDAIPRPRMATLREPRDPPKPVSSFFTGENPLPPSEKLASEEFLPPGPNNPAGIIWINLSKTDNPEILPYGLHGTGIPGSMNRLASIGGFRMPNWDIARATRMLPSGTLLFWKQSSAPAAAPAAAAVPAAAPVPTQTPASSATPPPAPVVQPAAVPAASPAMLPFRPSAPQP